MGWRRPSQALKSPTTLTLVALGAQTAKFTPSTPSIVAELRPELVVALPVPAFVQQVEVVVGQQVGKRVGIVHDALLSAFVGHPNHVPRRPSVHRCRHGDRWPRTAPPGGSAAWAGVRRRGPGRRPKPGSSRGRNARTASARRPLDRHLVRARAAQTDSRVFPRSVPRPSPTRPSFARMPPCACSGGGRTTHAVAAIAEKARQLPHRQALPAVTR